MTYSNLTNAHLNGSYLGKANFTNSCLINADMRGACLAGTIMQNSVVNGLMLCGAGLFRVNFSEAIQLEKITFGINLRGTILSDVRFTKSDLREAAFNGAEIRSVTLDHADLRGSDFTGVFGAWSHYSPQLFSSAIVDESTIIPCNHLIADKYVFLS